MTEKPKRPQNAYFKFRAIKFKEYGDIDGKTEKFKQDWENIDAKLKEKLENEYKDAMEAWKKENETWEKKNGKDEKSKASKSKPKKEETKPEKTKGSKKRS